MIFIFCNHPVSCKIHHMIEEYGRGLQKMSNFVKIEAKLTEIWMYHNFYLFFETPCSHKLVS